MPNNSLPIADQLSLVLDDFLEEGYILLKYRTDPSLKKDPQILNRLKKKTALLILKIIKEDVAERLYQTAQLGRGKPVFNPATKLNPLIRKETVNNMSINQFSELVVYDQDLKIGIAENMTTYGGSFVKALGEALLRADYDNTIRLVSAFHTYFTDYATWGDK